MDRIEGVARQFADTLGAMLASEGSREGVRDRIARLAGFDPTAPRLKCLTWMAALHCKGLLPLEDLPKARETLELFEANRQAMETRDLGRFRTLPDLWRAVERFAEAPAVSRSEADRAREASQLARKAATVVWDAEDCRVVRLKTKAAAMWWGRGTRWCTASRTDSMFAMYDGQGPLHVVLRKGGPGKWQLHEASGQLMDEADAPVSAELVAATVPSVRESPVWNGMMVAAGDPRAVLSMLVDGRLEPTAAALRNVFRDPGAAEMALSMMGEGSLPKDADVLTAWIRSCHDPVETVRHHPWLRDLDDWPDVVCSVVGWNRHPGKGAVELAFSEMDALRASGDWSGVAAMLSSTEWDRLIAADPGLPATFRDRFAATGRFGFHLPEWLKGEVADMALAADPGLLGRLATGFAQRPTKQNDWPDSLRRTVSETALRMDPTLFKRLVDGFIHERNFAGHGRDKGPGDGGWPTPLKVRVAEAAFAKRPRLAAMMSEDAARDGFHRTVPDEVRELVLRLAPSALFEYRAARDAMKGTGLFLKDHRKPVGRGTPHWPFVVGAFDGVQESNLGCLPQVGIEGIEEDPEALAVYVKEFASGWSEAVYQGRWSVGPKLSDLSKTKGPCLAPYFTALAAQFGEKDAVLSSDMPDAALSLLVDVSKPRCGLTEIRRVVGRRDRERVRRIASIAVRRWAARDRLLGDGCNATEWLAGSLPVGTVDEGTARSILDLAPVAVRHIPSPTVDDMLLAVHGEPHLVEGFRDPPPEVSMAAELRRAELAEYGDPRYCEPDVWDSGAALAA